jgi:hypothetical protein
MNSRKELKSRDEFLRLIMSSETVADSEIDKHLDNLNLKSNNSDLKSANHGADIVTQDSLNNDDFWMKMMKEGRDGSEWSIMGENDLWQERFINYEEFNPLSPKGTAKLFTD